MKQALIIICLSFGFLFPVVAQEFEVPKNCVLKAKEDYPKYQQDVLNAIDWAFKTPIDLQANKRKDVNAFLIMWLTGSPAVSIEVNSDIVTFIKPNAELIMIFMYGWAKHSIVNNTNDKVSGNIKGIEAVIDFYTKSKDKMLKDKNVEKYIKLKEKGTLESFIQKKTLKSTK